MVRNMPLRHIVATCVLAPTLVLSGCNSTPSDRDVGFGAKSIGFGKADADERCVGRAIKKAGVSDKTLKTISDAGKGDGGPGFTFSTKESEAIGGVMPTIDRC